MNSVLISIKPQWCELIASGKKTVEVRKTAPKIATPFKVYIYCTKSKNQFLQSRSNMFFYCEDRDFIGGHGAGLYKRLNGTVIGEFVCDAIFPMSIKYSDPESRLALKEFPFTCLTDEQIMDYLGNGKEGYGWHISDLLIYDKPKELGEFYVSADRTTDYPPLVKLKRPPQSWCYVEEVQTDDR